MFNLKPERVNYDLELGSGASGTVYGYQKNPNDTKWCVKHIVTNNSEQAFKSIQEIILAFSCESPNILSVQGYHLGYDKNRRQWDIFIKILRMKGSLSTIIETHRKEKTLIPENEVARYIYSISQGLQYLHKKGIAHRDLKPDNILLDEHKNPKIADFGLGDFYDNGTVSKSYALAEKVGSLLYAAPENLDNEAQLKRKDLLKCDLWSLGVLLFEICTLVSLRSLDMASGKQREAFFIKKAQEVTGGSSKTLVDLALRLLRSDPGERISLEEVLKRLEKYGLGEKIREENQYEKRIRALEEELEAKQQFVIEMEEMCKQMSLEKQLLRNVESEEIVPKDGTLVSQVLEKVEKGLIEIQEKVEELERQSIEKTDEIKSLIRLGKKTEAKDNLQRLKFLSESVATYQNMSIILEKIHFRLDSLNNLRTFYTSTLDMAWLALHSCDFSHIFGILTGLQWVSAFDPIWKSVDELAASDRESLLYKLIGILDKSNSSDLK